MLVLERTDSLGQADQVSGDCHDKFENNPREIAEAGMRGSTSTTMTDASRREIPRGWREGRKEKTKTGKDWRDERNTRGE